MSSPGHRFLVCRPPQPPVVWRPPETTDATGHDVGYFGRCLQIAVDTLGADAPPLVFVLTWDLDRLPETGRNVVAIVQGDEDARIPRWSDEVLATFKCYGTRPPWTGMGRSPGAIEALELAHFLRRAARWLPGAARRLRSLPGPGRPRAPIFTVPLGYYNQDDRPPAPFADRRWWVSFAGSGVQPTPRSAGWRGLVRTPKDRARAQMHAALRDLASAQPNLAITTVYRPEFPALAPGSDGEALGQTTAYSELLAETRVCLVPRGNSPETFRFFEAMRMGCILVCEPLPDHWFYRAAPVITIHRWDQLQRAIAPILADPHEADRLHRATVEWWRTRCSERAVGTFMAERIGAEL